MTLDEEPSAGRQSCTVADDSWYLAMVGGGECSDDERAFAFAPPPPRWLRKVLMTYPVPLFAEAPTDPGDEIHCTA